MHVNKKLDTLSRFHEYIVVQLCSLAYARIYIKMTHFTNIKSNLSIKPDFYNSYEYA